MDKEKIENENQINYWFFLNIKIFLYSNVIYKKNQ